MKMLLCSDVRLGAVSTEKLDVSLSHKWQTARNEKLEDLMDRAAQLHAGYVTLVGQLFGQKRVTESQMDTLFQLVGSYKELQVLLFVNSTEYERLYYRNDIPENLHAINMQDKSASFLDDEIAVRMQNGEAEIQLGDNESMVIKQKNDGSFVVAAPSAAYAIPIFEPMGFDDAQPCGYGILEWTSDALGEYSIQGNAAFAYRTIEVKIAANDDQKEILRKINNAIREVERDSFLRLTLTGQTAFGLMLSSEALKRQLRNHVFFVEVYDNTVMEIDEEEFATDISLRSEFVRLALADETLSESERNRIIDCGWKALSGEEVSEE